MVNFQQVPTSVCPLSHIESVFILYKILRFFFLCFVIQLTYSTRFDVIVALTCEFTVAKHQTFVRILYPSRFIGVTSESFSTHWLLSWVALRYTSSHNPSNDEKCCEGEDIICCILLAWVELNYNCQENWLMGLNMKRQPAGRNYFFSVTYVMIQIPSCGLVIHQRYMAKLSENEVSLSCYDMSQISCKYRRKLAIIASIVIFRDSMFI